MLFIFGCLENAVASITERLFDVLNIGGNLAAFKTKPLLRLKKLNHFAGFKGWPLGFDFLLLLPLSKLLCVRNGCLKDAVAWGMKLPSCFEQTLHAI